VQARIPAIILLVVMIATIVTVDLLFLRDQPLLRLVVNVGIVLVAGGIYYAFLRKA
jgi:hypothetical protein